MITDELIEILKLYPGHRVLVNGYEGGFDDPIIEVTTAAKVREGGYNGPYETEDLWENMRRFPCVIIGRNLEHR